MACRPRARRDQDPHQRVVIGVAAYVTGRLAADVQRPDADAGHEVGGPEHQRLQPRRRRRDGVHRGQAAGVLDLRLDSGPAGRQARLPLYLPEQQVQPHHVFRRGHLRQHDDVEPSRRGDDVDDVPVRPRSRGVVDPHGQHPAAPVTGHRSGRVRSGLRLGHRGHGVFQVEKHLVGGQPARLLDKPVAAGRHGQARSPDLKGVEGSVRSFHRVSLSPVRALPGA